MSAFTTLALAFLSTVALQPVPPPPPPVRVFAPSPPSAEQQAALAKVTACRHAFYGQYYLPQPPLFRLADGDTNLYILGSIHILPTGFDWRTPELDAIVARSDMLVTESGTSVQQARPSGDRLLNLPGTFPWEFASDPATPSDSTRPPLRDRLSGERRAKWMGMAAVGDRAMVRRLESKSDIEAAIGISVWLATLSGLGGGVETQLERDFGRAGKPIGKLEEPGTGTAILAAMPPDRQRQALEKALDSIGEPSRTDPLAMFHAWARGDAQDDPETTLFTPDIRRRILDERNAAWVPEVRKLLEKPGTRLIVVGAGHLKGRNNLIELLAATGLKADRISRTGTPLPRPAFTPKPRSLSDCLEYFPKVTPPRPPAPPAAKPPAVPSTGA